MNAITNSRRLKFLLTSTIIASISTLVSADLSHEKIIIAGVAKNIEHTLPNMAKKIETLGSHFNDYRVIIYENNSSDKSSYLLTEWSKSNPKVIVITEKLTPSQLYDRVTIHRLKDKAPNKIELIAYGRNQVLMRALDKQFDDYKYIVMTDLDFSIGWTVESVLSSFSIQIPWDCISANGIHNIHGKYGIYFDRYAFRDERFPLGPELLGNQWWDEIYKKTFDFKQGSALKKVYSAFGGIAIYKRESLKNCRYSGCITDDLTNLLSMILNQKNFESTAHFLQYKKLLGSEYEKLPVKFQPQSRYGDIYDGTLVCEHVNLHASMIHNKHDKIFVNPDMICIYLCSSLYGQI